MNLKSRQIHACLCRSLFTTDDFTKANYNGDSQSHEGHLGKWGLQQLRLRKPILPHCPLLGQRYFYLYSSIFMHSGKTEVLMLSGWILTTSILQLGTFELHLMYDMHPLMYTNISPLVKHIRHEDELDMSPPNQD